MAYHSQPHPTFLLTPYLVCTSSGNGGGPETLEKDCSNIFLQFQTTFLPRRTSSVLAQEMAEAMTPSKDVVSAEERNLALQRIAKVAKKQGSWQLAAKKYTQVRGRGGAGAAREGDGGEARGRGEGGGKRCCRGAVGQLAACKKKCTQVCGRGG